MKIIGCDFHPSFQQIAMVDTETGEMIERRLLHAGGEAQRFYEGLRGEVVVGIESSGNTLWFERVLAKLQHKLLVGNPTAIAAANPRRQKCDRRDARHILQMLQEQRFPALWMPTMAERDLRQLLKHRHTLVQMRTRAKNQLQHIALNQGLQKKSKLWTQAGMEQLKNLELEPWTKRRRDDLLQILEQMDAHIEELNQAVAEEAQRWPQAVLLMTHPGVGPITALATVVTLGDVSRFERGKKVASYVGLIPSEDSSGQHRRLGAITKQGNRFMRFLLVQAGLSAAKGDAELARAYQRLRHKKHHGVAKVAMARKLVVRLYWMLRTNTRYPEVVRMQGSSSHPVAEVMADPLSGRPASRCSTRPAP
ncbi:MAG TPA: IS110 family transposase [Candidatus Angelobacter sp.]